MDASENGMADAISWFREQGWDGVVRDRTSDDAGGRHRPALDRGFVWWCDLVSIEHPEIVLDGFGIARAPEEAVAAARRRWAVEGFRPGELESDPVINDAMVSALIEEFWVVARAVNDDPSSSGWDVVGAAGLESLVVGPWFRPPTATQRDTLRASANAMYDTDEITAEQIDGWIDDVRWRWPTTMEVLSYTEDGWTDKDS